MEVTWDEDSPLGGTNRYTFGMEKGNTDIGVLVIVEGFVPSTDQLSTRGKIIFIWTSSF